MLQRIINGGTISGPAVVKDNAMVAGGTISDAAIVPDNAVVWGGTITGNGKVDGCEISVCNSEKTAGYKILNRKNYRIKTSSNVNGSGIVCGSAKPTLYLPCSTLRYYA